MKEKETYDYSDIIDCNNNGSHQLRDCNLLLMSKRVKMMCKEWERVHKGNSLTEYNY